jgi:hypothetical protein
VIVGLLLAVGVSQVIAPSGSEPGSGRLLQTLWTDPIPSFLVSSVTGAGGASDLRGLVPTDPPRILAAPAVASSDAKAPPVVKSDPVPPTASHGIPIRVYFSRHPDSESAFAAVFPVSRVSPDRAVATAALADLIAGPNPSERAAGYFSELAGALTGPSTCSGRDVSVTIANGLATVRFCRAVASAGIGQDARIRSQIETTLRQFSTVRSVRLLSSASHCLFDESGQDRCLNSGVAAVPQPGASNRAR